MTAVSSVKMDVPRPVYDWLAGLRKAMSADRKRNVTFAEVLELVKAEHERTAALVADIKAADR